VGSNPAVPTGDKGQLSWPFLWPDINAAAVSGHLILHVRAYCLRESAAGLPFGLIFSR